MPVLNWVRRHLVVFAGVAALAYMTIPNVIVLIFSFNQPKGRFNYSWNHFSLDAWKNPCGVGDMCDSVSLSLQIAVLATLGATVLGTMVAFALGRYRFRGRGPVTGLIWLPMAMPEIVMGASLGTLFLNMRIQFGFLTILIAHIMFCLSFVVTAVKARVMSMDPRLEQAAQDLYATPWSTFWRITFPIAAPGIAAGALLSFAISIDDFIITQFNAGPATVTFPMFVWGAAQKGLPVQVNVIGTLMFVAAVLCVVVGQLLSRRRKAHS
ncbi:ABC transporter permease [Actinacidiphila glaucinigra]|uniref:Spermidine/putrescine transport system permease protein n=1 Tax=Actinacidiphila glaucinigra TaxID=235986 RepID=A0A239GSJ3_9ACTN|nr:ABC transporter permease [Actinacidiphila glaucinigra]WSD59847.1 ABC transporter permease [Actinacidiphila glaucinigra]SNS71758.1 spermidine/putrescine transport system permease protein [Actinacidiphila glaucinigra]